MSRPTVIRLPVSRSVSHLFVVFFAPGANDPKFHELKARLTPALDSLLGEPLRSLAVSFAQSRLTIDLEKRERLPPVPIGLLRHLGLDELDERKLESSTLALMIGASDDNRPPRTALWTALAAAYGCAQILNGTIFDPGATRVLKPIPRGQALSSDGGIAVGEHIVVPFSVDRRGWGWMTTKGLAKFGLLDLEVRDVPPNLQGMGYLLNATAQHLIGRLDRLPSLDPDLELPRDLSISSRDLAAAFGRTDGDREIVIGVEVTESFLRLVRPRGAGASHGKWVFEAVQQFLGTNQEIVDVQASSDAMHRAHERAMAELPRIRTRFARGLRPGETLYVKHGFPAGNRGKEYMWVVVKTWAGTRVYGQLINNARDSNLRAGQEVELDESELFDWMLDLDNGEHEGGYTTDVALREGHGGQG